MRRDRVNPVHDTDRDLAVELTGLALARVAPDEIVLLDESAAEFFENPAAALGPSRRDTPLGAGIDVAMLTPYLLSVASVVLPVLAAFAGDIARDVTKDLVKDPAVAQIRSMFRRQPDDAGDSAGVTSEQAAHIRRVVIEHCQALGLSSQQAGTIADATVGSLHVRR